MLFIKRHLADIAVLVIACLLYTCSTKSKKVVHPEEYKSLLFRSVLLYQTVEDGGVTRTITWQAESTVVKDDHLEMYIPVIPVLEDRTRQVHIYIDKTISMPDSLPGTLIVPFANIDKIEVYDTDVGKVIFVTLGVIVLTFAVISLIILLTKESCPFIYAFDGEYWQFSGEIYSGAIHPPLERHDYLPLPAVQAVDDKYKIKMTNEVHEIQYTNLAELIVLDHPPGSEALIDKYGKAHTLTRQKTAERAVNLNGEDIRKKIINRDDIFYTGSDITRESHVLDEIFLTFDRPKETDTAKLVVRAKNSLWLDYIYGQLYTLFGDYYQDFQQTQRSADPKQMEQWSLDQGIPLSVYIEKNGKWHFVDYYHIAGPLAAKDDVLPLDLSGIGSDQVRIKLSYGLLFWEIDYVAMDFSSDIAVEKNIVTLRSAIDQNDQDVSGLLNADDEEYQVLAQIGDQVVLDFPVPALKSNYIRTTILHTKGHYTVLRDPRGTPDIAYLKSFREPGRFLEFSKAKILEIYRRVGMN